MSITLLDGVVKKNRARLIPFMLALYVLAFLDRSNIGFAKETYQIDTGLSNEAYALGAGIFFVVYAFLGVPANLLMRKFGARTWIGTTTLLWGFLSAGDAWFYGAPGMVLDVRYRRPTGDWRRDIHLFLA